MISIVESIYSNTLPSILLDSNNTAENQMKKSRSKRQISVRLHASRIKKLSYSSSSNTLKIQLFQMCTDSTRWSSKCVRKFALLNKAFSLMKFQAE